MTHINWRVPIGFALAPFAPTFGIGLFFAVLSGSWRELAGVGAAVVVMCWALTLLVAAPAYALLRRRRAVRLIDCVCIGVGVGILLSLAFIAGTWISLSGSHSTSSYGGVVTVIDGRYTTHGMAVEAVWTIEYAVFGASIGTCFWLIALRSRASDPRRHADAAKRP